MGERTYVAPARSGDLLPEVLAAATVNRLDRIIDRARCGDRASGLDSYGRVINWAWSSATLLGTAAHWARAQRPDLHEAVNRGVSTLVDIDATAVIRVYKVLRDAQNVVTYTPTMSTAVGWLLDVAEQVRREDARRDAGGPAG